VAEGKRGWVKTEHGWEPRDQRIKEILFQVQAGRPYKDIAAQFSITISRVSHLRRQAGIIRPPRPTTNPLTREPRVKQFNSHEHQRQYMGSQLNQAVKAGFIIRPSACSDCGATDVPIHGHHYKGYAWENRFEVEWLCPGCHRRHEQANPNAVWRIEAAEIFRKRYAKKLPPGIVERIVAGLLDPVKQLSNDEYDEFYQLHLSTH
jgi:hypothetical protein